MKKLLTVIIVGISSACFAGCTNGKAVVDFMEKAVESSVNESEFEDERRTTEDRSSEAETDNIFDELLGDRKDNTTEKQNYEWVVKPTIEAEEIIVFDTSFIPKHGTPRFVNRDEYGDEYSETLSHDKFAIIKKNGKYGFIGYDGELLTELEYEDYGYAYCGEIYLRASEGKCYLDKNGNKVYGLCMCGDGFFNIEYDTETQTISSEFWREELNKIDVAVPVVRRGDHSAVAGENIGNYGIYRNGALITDFQYDNYKCCIISDPYNEVVNRITTSYSFAMCKDEKWYLFNREGRKILDDPCESPLYLFTEGICAITQNGQGRYIDLDGNDVIPAGEFEELKPVYNGLAWVKKDGKWGIIKVLAAKAEETESVKNYDDTTKTNQLDVYTDLLDKYIKENSEYKSQYGYCRYYLYDFENDGIPEILIETGRCEAERKIDVYTLDEKEMKLLGTFISDHMGLGASDAFSYQGLPMEEYDYHDLYGYQRYNGEDTIYKISVSNGELKSEIYSTTRNANYKELESYSYDYTVPISNIELP